MKSPIVPPSVKTPTPEPAELETRKVSGGRLKPVSVVGRRWAGGGGCVCDRGCSLPQVLQMQCNIEPIDEGAKHHVSSAAAASEPRLLRGWCEA